MPSGAWLAVAQLCSVGGLAWLALAMDAHWQQVRRTHTPPGRATVAILRLLGVAALAASLLVCLHADHPTMAALVWVMSLAVAAFAVALTLTWRPRWLAWLAAWAGRA